MKTVLTAILIFAYIGVQSQATNYSYNFGTNATNSKATKGKVTNFFSGATNPEATPSGGGTYQLDLHSDPPPTALSGLITTSGPSTITNNSVPYFPSNFGSGTRFYMRGEPGDAGNPTSSNSFSVRSISSAQSSFSIAFDFYINEAGVVNNQDGDIIFMIGNEGTNNNAFSKGHVHSTTAYDQSSIFMGLKINFNNGATTATTWTGSNWSGTNLTNSAWANISTGAHRLVILANNSSSQTTATFSNGTSETTASRRFDIFLDGTNVANDITNIGSLTSGANLNSFLFDVGFNSNAQNITLLLDNLTYQVSTNGAQAAALPVTLSSFTAKPTPDNKVSLAWVTSTEQVNKGFRIERQAGNENGKFEQIGFVGSKAKDGNSQNMLTYNFIDAAPKVGAASFYRLVQEDLDGKLTYTEVRVVKLNGQSVSMVFPNPSNGAVNISRTADGKKMNIQVIDQSGKIISQVNNITDANYKLNIPQSGIYSIKMTYPETGEQSIQRIVVQK